MFGMEPTQETELPPAFRRRDFLKFSVLALGAYAAVKAGYGVVVHPAGDVMGNAVGLVHLTPRQAAVFQAAAPLLAGPRAEAALRAGHWDPVRDLDGMLERLAPDQRRMIGAGLLLLEHGRVGWQVFSRLGRDRRAAYLDRWRTSSPAVRRSTWGFMHAAACFSFAGGEVAWKLMGYPGPCLSVANYPGRPPGQSTRFDWDPAVP